MDTRFLILTFGNLVVGTGSLVIAGILAPIAADLDVAVSAAGQLTTAYALAFAIGAPVVAFAAGSLDRKVLLLAGLIGTALTTLLGAMATSFELLLASRILAGLSGAAFSPTAIAVAAALSAPERRGQAIALVFGGLTLASVAGVPLGTWAGDLIGWRGVLAGVAVGALVSFVATAFMLPGKVVLPPANAAAWRAVVSTRKLRALLGVTMLQMAGTFAVFAFMGPYLIDRHNLGTGGITAILAVYGAAGFLGNLVAGWLIDQTTPKAVANGALGVVAVGLGAMILPLPFDAGLYFGIVAWGGAVFAINTAQQARLVSHAPELMSAVLPANSSALFAGQAFGAAVGGVALAAFGTFVVLPVLGLILVVAALSVSASVDHNRNQGAAPQSP